MSQPQAIIDPDVERFFREIRPLVDAPPAQAFKERSLSSFFSDAGRVIDAAETEDRERNRLDAHRFNLLTWIEPDENKLSDILADLLDPRGRHGQGDRFLRLLLQKLNLAGWDSSMEGSSIQREAPTHGIAKYRRRIDILIESCAIVAIENKIDSLEQQEQVSDYLNHLQFLARTRNKPATLIYLTPNGRPPDSVPLPARRQLQEEGRLHCWSYSKELQEWLLACQTACKAQKVRFFLADFVSYINDTLKRQSFIEDSEEAP